MTGWPPPPKDPLRDLSAKHRAALVAAYTGGVLVLIGRSYRGACAMTSGGKHTPQIVRALERKGLLRRLDADRLVITSRGRPLARVARHRAAVRAQLMKERQ